MTDAIITLLGVGLFTLAVPLAAWLGYRSSKGQNND